jgi:hypothetical protein
MGHRQKSKNGRRADEWNIEDCSSLVAATLCTVIDREINKYIYIYIYIYIFVIW